MRRLILALAACVVFVSPASGLPFNIRSNQDLNKDGVSSDRPLNIARNSIYLPNRYNMDVR
jgi:hypothetical protein